MALVEAVKHEVQSRVNGLTREEALEWVKNDPWVLANKELIPEEYRQDREFMRVALERDGLILSVLPHARNDQELIFIACRTPFASNHVSLKKI